MSEKFTPFTENENGIMKCKGRKDSEGLLHGEYVQYDSDGVFKTSAFYVKGRLLDPTSADSILTQACYFDEEKNLFEYLRDLGYDLNDTYSIQHQQLSLMNIIVCAKLDIKKIRKLVKQLIAVGVAVNLQDVYGNTPLNKALLCRRNSVAKILIEKGADVTIKNKKDQTAYDIAVLKEIDEIIQILEEKKKKEDEEIEGEKAEKSEKAE